jgi:hypothetical protein
MHDELVDHTKDKDDEEYVRRKIIWDNDFSFYVLRMSTWIKAEAPKHAHFSLSDSICCLDPRYAVCYL